MAVPKPMIIRRFAHTFAGFCLIGFLLNSASAQYLPDALSDHYVDSDLEFFRPVDFDFENHPMKKQCGYFFNYEKLSWAFTGDRVVIGDPNESVQSEIIYQQTGSSEGTAPPTYTINNSVQDAPPSTDFGWGNRYEFGKFNKGKGWMVSVLEGPEVETSEIYGFQELAIPNTLPLTTRENDDIAEGITAIIGGLGPNDLSTSRNGFGSVHVNFDTPEGFLLGFRDYWVGNPGNTLAGPGRVLVVTGTNTEEVNGTLTVFEITEAGVISGGDLIPDDLDGDGSTFTVILGDVNGDGTIDDDEIIATAVDFDDLHLFNIRFDTLVVQNRTRVDGAEFMRTHDLSNRHKMMKRQNTQATIAYGLRYFQLDDEFYWEGHGDVLGLTYADTTVRNSIVGPQIRGMWSTQRGRLSFSADGRFMFGVNIQDQDQIGAIGQDLVPGALNRPANAQPHAVRYGRHKETFSPLIEFRAESSYQITNSIAAKLGYNATFIDNITRAHSTMRWYLPDLGILEGGQDNIFINGINFGLEVTH